MASVRATLPTVTESDMIQSEGVRQYDGPALKN